MILKQKKGKILRKFQYFKKILGKMSKFFPDTLENTFQNILAYFFLQNLLHRMFLRALGKSDHYEGGKTPWTTKKKTLFSQ